jgi:choline-sulfatase
MSNPNGNKEKPNILLIMVDQMVPFLSRAYGHPVVKTPNLNRLVKSGIRFDAAYTSCPLCAPARASFMTGQYVSRIKCYDNASPLSSAEPTIAHYLSIEGYDTILSGKMHFIGPDQLHGFRRRLTTDIYPADFEWTTSREVMTKPQFDKPIAGQYVTAGVRAWSRGLAYDEETHFRALEYLHSTVKGVDAWEAGRAHEPFFLCASYHHPHEPFHVTQELWDLYEGEQIDIPEFPDNLEATYSTMDRWCQMYHGVDYVDLKNPQNLYKLRRAYYGLISYVDQKVGELVKALEDTGLRNNTIIVFTSDHGDMLGERGMVQKRHFYEWSTRVPLIITFPDRWKEGTVITQPVSLVDLAAAILDMGGVEDRLPMDGKSLIELIDGQDTNQRDVFSEIHTAGVLATCFMIRRGKYKYTYVHGEEPQLFDLENDPEEWHNLAGNPQYGEIEEDLKARILEQFNPDQIEHDVRESLLKRQLIRKVMKINDTHWDCFPHFDASKQYVRGTPPVLY